MLRYYGKMDQISRNLWKCETQGDNPSSVVVVIVFVVVNVVVVVDRDSPVLRKQNDIRHRLQHLRDSKI